MCVACHTEPDPDYPSVLILGETRASCGDCHMKAETVDVSWVKDMNKPARLSIAGEDREGKLAEGALRDLIVKDLRERGFLLDGDGENAPDVAIRLRLRTVRENRFLPEGCSVRVATLEATLTLPGDDRPLFRRLGESKPEWGETEDEAVSRALQDAWKVLGPFLLEAMGSY